MSTVLALLPLVAYWLVEAWAGTRSAIVVGIALAAVDVGVTWRRDGRVGRLPLVSAALVAGLGGLSLASDDPRFVLWTPVVSDLLFGGLVAGAWLRGGHVLATMLQEQDPEVELHPLQIAWLDGLTLRLAANLGLHAALTAWSTGQPHGTWLFVSGPLQYVLIGAQFGIELGWARWVLLPRVEALEDARGDH